MSQIYPPCWSIDQLHHKHQRRNCRNSLSQALFLLDSQIYGSKIVNEVVI